jgi:hypothetical protein
MKNHCCYSNPPPSVLGAPDELCMITTQSLLGRTEKQESTESANQFRRSSTPSECYNRTPVRLISIPRRSHHSTQPPQRSSTEDSRTNTLPGYHHYIKNAVVIIRTGIPTIIGHFAVKRLHRDGPRSFVLWPSIRSGRGQYLCGWHGLRFRHVQGLFEWANL